MPLKPLRSLVLPAFFLALASAVQANSFMLRPGAPTNAEVAQHIVALETRLERTLTGAQLNAFQAERRKALLAAQECSGEACQRAQLERRERELEALLAKQAPKRTTDDDVLCNRRVCP